MLSTYLASAGPVAAREPAVRIWVFGVDEALPGAQIVQGRTWVPLREACRRMGCEVAYGQGEVRVFAGGREVLRIDLRLGAARRVDGPAGDIPVRVHRGRTLVPLRVLAEAVGGRISWDASDPEGPTVRVLSPWPIRRQLADLRRELGRIDAEARDVRAADEAAARRIWAMPWPWLLYLDRPGWTRGPSLPPLLVPWHVLFWGDDRRRFMARVVDKGFGLDTKSPYVEGEPPTLDALLYVDLTAPAGQELQWVAHLRPGAEDRSFPGLAPYLSSWGRARILVEHGTRPAITGQLRAWAEGPGFMVPLYLR